MNLLITGFFLFVFLFSPRLSLAVNAPSLISPSDNSIVTDSSPRLSWSYSGQCPSSGSCFNVQVSTSSAFVSLNKNYYTNSTSYSPQLSLSQWFWKVKAKDNSGVWSNWSSVFSFTVAPSPSPTSSPTPISQPSPNSVQTELPNALPTESPTDFSSSEATDSTSEPNPAIISINLFDKASSRSVLPVSTRSSLPTPRSKKEEFLAQSEINPSRILIILGVVIIIISGGIILKSFVK